MVAPVLGRGGKAIPDRASDIAPDGRDQTTRRVPSRAVQDTPEKLRANIECIADYTAKHPELRRAHHWLYDLRSPPDGKPQFVIMGINPGETERDWEALTQPH